MEQDPDYAFQLQDDSKPTPKPEKGVPEIAAVQFPRYVVNLDLPPEERWQHVINDFAGEFKKVEETVEELIREAMGPRLGPVLEKIASSILSGANKVGLVFYGQELAAISRQTGLPLGRLVMMQLTYEAAVQSSLIKF
jgi:hypothetical protein